METYALAEYSKQKGDETRRKIAEYFAKKPYAHHQECATALGVSRWTVHRHLKSMRQEDSNERLV